LAWQGVAVHGMASYGKGVVLIVLDKNKGPLMVEHQRSQRLNY
jgi:hypothetical protein